jgi:hypothetical protein
MLSTSGDVPASDTKRPTASVRRSSEPRASAAATVLCRCSGSSVHSAENTAMATTACESPSAPSSAARLFFHPRFSISDAASARCSCFLSLPSARSSRRRASSSGISPSDSTALRRVA